MEKALALAWSVKGRTLPNPPVGAVLVKNDRIVGQGGTRPAGQAHAEIVALESARGAANGATLYVTLEPCRHFGKTPPCTRALIGAGVKKVVAACADPNPRMAGKGLAELRRAGITVESGLLAETAARLYDGFFFQIVHGRPKIVLKIAQTLDGRINRNPGKEIAITGFEAQRFSHRLRAESDAVLIGGGTLRADNPRLTPRWAEGPVPEALVLTRGALAGNFRLFARNRPAKTTVLTAAGTGNRLPDWVDVMPLPRAAKHGGADLLQALFQVFRQKGYHKVLVEGGRSVWAPFLNSGMCDGLCLVTAPKLFGSGEGWREGLIPGWAKSLEFHRFTPLGQDVLAEFRRVRKPARKRP
jgi:diaminohydroxyphosphoribosylaminopyrimidine deaminase/5-amino-6-(5-phosphoribosylamino)uracil reductase